MDSLQLDRKRVYDLIHKRITKLEMAPGSPINEHHLAQELGLDLGPVHEALELLAHDGLVDITSRHEHGIAVAPVYRADLDQLSQVRLTLEALSARLAAREATDDDLDVLESLRQEQSALGAGDSQRLLDLDHRFHQAIAQAAHNRYLSDALERFFGLSLRLWYLALPHLGFLPSNLPNC